MPSRNVHSCGLSYGHVQVSERYRAQWKSGLTQEGLVKTYEDSYGDVDNDYETLFWSEQVCLTSPAAVPPPSRV